VPEVWVEVPESMAIVAKHGAIQQQCFNPHWP
jgi:hypothetical protein